MKYYIHVPETHIVTYEVDAPTKEKAVEIVLQGDGIEHKTEFDSVSDSWEWEVTDSEGKHQ